jgi:GNAT superfamily N-acetyltransferase
VDELRDAAARAAATDLLVAVDDAGMLIGTVTFAPPGSGYAEITEGPAEAGFRMLAVAGGRQGQGVGTALVQACIDLARAAGCTTLRLSTEPRMTAAQRMYGRLGFVRTPELDWDPGGVPLLTYALELA